MDRIKLSQLIQYYDEDREKEERIQIVINQEWDQADEVSIHSALLDSVMDYFITDISIEGSFRNCAPIIRVGIEP